MIPFGWLSPAGEMVECEFMEHGAMADKLVGKYKYPTTPEDYYRSDDVLMRNGWVHITMSIFDHKFRIYWDKFLTEPQKSYLKPIFAENKEDIETIYLHIFEDEIGEEGL